MLPTISGTADCLAIIEEGRLKLFPFSKSEFTYNLMNQDLTERTDLKSVLISSESICVISKSDHIFMYYYQKLDDEDDDYDNDNDDSDTFSVDSNYSDDSFLGGKKGKKSKKSKTTKSAKKNTLKNVAKKEYKKIVNPPKSVNGEIVKFTCHDNCYFVVTDENEIYGFGNNNNDRISFIVVKNDEEVQTNTLSKRTYAKATIDESFLVGKKVSLYGCNDETLNKIISKMSGSSIIKIEILDTLYFFYTNDNTVRILGYNLLGIINSDETIVDLTIEDVQRFISGDKYIVVITGNRVYYYSLSGSKEMKLSSKLDKLSYGLNYKAYIEEGKIKLTYYRNGLLKKTSKKDSQQVSNGISCYKDFFEFCIDNMGINYFVSNFEIIPSIFYDSILSKFNSSNLMPKEELLNALDNLLYIRIIYTLYINKNDNYEKMFFFKNIKVFGISGSVMKFPLFICMMMTIIESYYEKNYGPVPQNPNYHKYMNEDIDFSNVKYNLKKDYASDDEDLVKDDNNSDTDTIVSYDNDESSFVSMHNPVDENTFELPQNIEIKMLEITDFIHTFQSYFETFENYSLMIKSKTEIAINEELITERFFVDIIPFEDYFIAVDSDGNNHLFNVLNPIYPFKNAK